MTPIPVLTDILMHIAVGAFITWLLVNGMRWLADLSAHPLSKLGITIAIVPTAWIVFFFDRLLWWMPPIDAPVAGFVLASLTIGLGAMGLMRIAKRRGNGNGSNSQ